MSSYPYYRPRTPQNIDTRTLVDELNELEERDEDDDPLDADELERRDAIRELFEEITGDAGSSPIDGIHLIPEDGFEDYARELAQDVEGFGEDSMLASYVDWGKWADAVMMDYTSVEFDGTTYYYR